jgi:dihydrofolate reductase
MMREPGVALATAPVNMGVCSVWTTRARPKGCAGGWRRSTLPTLAARAQDEVFAGRSHPDKQRRIEVRKVIAAEFVSLDGVMESPDQWHFPYFNDEMGQAIGEGFATSDAMLMGRVLYEEWAAYWPQQDPEENPVAEQMNGVQKYVVSTTLEGPLEWQNSTLIQGDVAEEISELKRQPGKDIVISGSGALVRSLLRDGLIDELRLMVHPIVVGSGKRLFEDGGEQTALELVESKTFATGVLYLIYRPASE